MHIRTAGIFGFILLTYFFSLSSVHALGVDADLMCDPYYDSCPCNYVPDQKDPKKCVYKAPTKAQDGTLKPSNTHACSVGVCLDVTNQFRVRGTCEAPKKCKAVLCEGNVGVFSSCSQTQIDAIEKYYKPINLNSSYILTPSNSGNNSTALNFENLKPTTIDGNPSGLFDAEGWNSFYENSTADSINQIANPNDGGTQTATNELLGGSKIPQTPNLNEASKLTPPNQGEAPDPEANLGSRYGQTLTTGFGPDGKTGSEGNDWQTTFNQIKADFSATLEQGVDAFQDLRSAIGDATLQTQIPKPQSIGELSVQSAALFNNGSLTNEELAARTHQFLKFENSKFNGDCNTVSSACGPAQYIWGDQYQKDLKSMLSNARQLSANGNEAASDLVNYIETRGVDSDFRGDQRVITAMISNKLAVNADEATAISQRSGLPIEAVNQMEHFGPGYYGALKNNPDAPLPEYMRRPLAEKNGVQACAVSCTATEAAQYVGEQFPKRGASYAASLNATTGFNTGSQFLPASYSVGAISYNGSGGYSVNEALFGVSAFDIDSLQIAPNVASNAAEPKSYWQSFKEWVSGPSNQVVNAPPSGLSDAGIPDGEFYALRDQAVNAIQAPVINNQTSIERLESNIRRQENWLATLENPNGGSQQGIANVGTRQDLVRDLSSLRTEYQTLLSTLPENPTEWTQYQAQQYNDLTKSIPEIENKIVEQQKILFKDYLTANSDQLQTAIKGTEAIVNKFDPNTQNPIERNYVTKLEVLTAIAELRDANGGQLPQNIDPFIRQFNGFSESRIVQTSAYLPIETSYSINPNWYQLDGPLNTENILGISAPGLFTTYPQANVSKLLSLPSGYQNDVTNPSEIIRSTQSNISTWWQLNTPASPLNAPAQTPFTQPTITSLTIPTQGSANQLTSMLTNANNFAGLNGVGGMGGFSLPSLPSGSGSGSKTSGSITSPPPAQPPPTTITPPPQQTQATSTQVKTAAGIIGIPDPWKGQDYKLGDDSPNIRILQKFLNSHGALVATDGPGSQGNESTYFGEKTVGALKIFQRAQSLSETGSLNVATRNRIGVISQQEETAAANSK